MTTKNILEKAASLLELTVNFNTVNATSARFLSCAEYIVHELTSQYYQLKKTEKVTSTGRINYSSLSKSPVIRVLSVKKEGKSVRFSEDVSGITTEQTGEVEITYSYCLKDLEINTTIELFPRFTDDLLALGVASEYCYRTGFSDGAQKYGEKYTNALQNIVGVRKTVILPTRSYL